MFDKKNDECVTNTYSIAASNSSIRNEVIPNIIDTNHCIESDGYDTLNILYSLISRYFFKNTIRIIDYPNSLTNEMLHNMQTLLSRDSVYIICVDVHNSISLFTYDAFNKFNKNINKQPITYDGDMGVIFDLLDPLILTNYVEFRLSKQSIKNKIRILYDTLLLVIENESHEIERSVFDLLYTSSNDIFPIKGNTDIVITTQTRHVISYKDTTCVDMSKNDVKYICHLQDELINEYNRIYPVIVDPDPEPDPETSTETETII